MFHRFRSARPVAVGVLLAAILGGCAEASRQLESMEQKSATEKLEVGMSRDRLVSLMGTPARRENYGSMQFYIYETNYLALSESGQFTPVAVVDGKVAGWGRDYYDAAVEAQSRWDSKVVN